MSHATDAPAPGAKLVNSPYVVNVVSAGIAGLISHLLLIPAIYALYFAYREDSMDLPLLFGAFLVAPTDMQSVWLARILGMGAFLGIGVVTGIAYAVLLRVFRWQSNGGKGSVFGILVFVPTFAFIVPWTVGFLARFAPTHWRMNNPDVMFNQVGHGNVGWEPAGWMLCCYIIAGLVLGTLYRHKTLEMGGRYRLEYQGG
jgi:hypothetical protein